MGRSRSAGSDLRRRVPSVDDVLGAAGVRELIARCGRSPVVRAVRAALDEAREAAARGERDALEGSLAALADSVARRVAAGAAPSLRRVINATGVVVHTNLGRAPLPERAARHVAEIATGYSNLEYDLPAGRRGSREAHAEVRLRELLGCESVVVVNNNAAAVLLAVNALAEGREVLVSRGELVEIGGSFRIPDVLRKGGARLREVGTTNRTRIADFEAALGPETAMILKVHPSNFRIVGFAEQPQLAQLVELAERAGVPLVEDVGSGLLAPLEAVPGEPTAAETLRRGVDVVTFSGDKLLGGPQAGVAAGRRAFVDAMRRNPLYRALRVDKLTLAALDAVLVDHDSGAARERIPVLRMLSADPEALRARAEAFAAALSREAPGAQVAVEAGSGAVGGGAAPTRELPGALVTVRGAPGGPDALAAALRVAEPPVVARVADGALVIDLRTVHPEEERALLEALARAARAPSGS